MTSRTFAAAPHAPWQASRRAGPLLLIVLLHLGLIYALQSGLLKRAVPSMPHEVFATLIASPIPQSGLPDLPVARPKQVPRPSVTPNAPLSNPDNPIAAAEPEVSVVLAARQPVAPSTQAAPIDTNVVKTISSGVEYLQSPRPEYPALARRMREEGQVVLRVLVDENGRPERIELQQSSGSARLDEAARLAVLRALFKPH